MSSPADVATTEISIAGANCPWCFNDTVELLRAEPGVIAVHGSIASQCLRIDHTDVAADRLLSIVRQQLHADDLSSTEHLMGQVDARLAELHCTHGQPSASDPSGAAHHA